MLDTPTLPAIRIWYESLPGVTLTKWPLVEVSITYQDQSLPQPIVALVDSGASISILHIDVLDLLGIERKALQVTSGGISVSGNYRSALLPHNASVSLYGHTHLLRLTVIDNPNLAFPCILGEDSIFHWARLDFQQFNGFYEIKFRRDVH